MADSQDSVADGRVVLFNYTLKSDAGDVLDQSADGDPLPYLHGAGNIVPGLERAMLGKTVGDKFEVKVPPEEGYGPKGGPGPQALPRSGFPADAQIEAGMQFTAETEDGNVMPLWVTEVRDNEVMVDINHPLAGVTLHFSIEVVGVRDATDQEREHGHPHGPDGHEAH